MLSATMKVKLLEAAYTTFVDSLETELPANTIDATLLAYDACCSIDMWSPEFDDRFFWLRDCLMANIAGRITDPQLRGDTSWTRGQQKSRQRWSSALKTSSQIG